MLGGLRSILTPSDRALEDLLRGPTQCFAILMSDESDWYARLWFYRSRTIRPF